MDESIKAELIEAGVPLNLDADESTGDISYWFRGSGRPMLYAYNRFSNVAAIRILQNWDVTGTAHDKYPPAGSLSFSVIVDHDAGLVRVTFGVPYWEQPTTGSVIRVLNSAATGELLVRFLQPLPATNDGRFSMSLGSHIYVKDVLG